MLAVAGSGAFRVGVQTDPRAPAPSAPLPTRMISPSLNAANATIFHGGAAGADAVGLNASFGAISISPSTGVMALFDAAGGVLSTAPLLLLQSSSGSSGDSCESAGAPSTDKGNGERVGALVVDLQSDCCGACLTASGAGCDAWVFADPPEASTGDNCWLMRGVTRTKAAANRTFGRVGSAPPGGGAVALALGGAAGGRMYGSGGGATPSPSPSEDPYAAAAASPAVGNTAWFVPSVWASDGYGALGVASANHSAAALAKYPASWARSSGGAVPKGGGGGSDKGGDGDTVVWTFEGTAADLYLMPARTLKDGVAAIAALTGGMRAVPPRYAFGFLACRWGWSNRSYIEATLATFRRGGFPLDAFISDYGWFTAVPNSPLQDDFGWNGATFPDPAAQLAAYRGAPYRVRFGAIRKPRLENASLLAFAAAQPGGHWLLADGAGAKGGHNLNMSTPAVRAWYAARQLHYLSAGVDFFWNDEGETEYFTYDAWNEAHGLALAAHDPARRLFTLNRAFTPGLGRAVASVVWTGDISVSWRAFQDTPATVLRWALAGAPFVACDTGGFEGGATPPELLARWYQLSALLPIMRVHSRVTNPPHWPWLYGAEAEAAMRVALALRYTLVPFLYSLAHAASLHGAPMARPLLFDFPADGAPAVARSTDTFTLGGTLLAAPVMEQGAANRSVTFPKYELSGGGGAAAGGWFEVRDGGAVGGWLIDTRRRNAIHRGHGTTRAPAFVLFIAPTPLPARPLTTFRSLPPPAYVATARLAQFNSSALHAGGSAVTFPVTLSTIPLFVRQATVLPLAPAGVQYTDALASAGALDVQVYAGGDAAFQLVEDDGETRAYQQHAGGKRTVEFYWDDSGGALSWRSVGSFGSGGDDPGAFKQIRATLFCPGALPLRHAAVPVGKNGVFEIGKC